MQFHVDIASIEDFAEHFGAEGEQLRKDIERGPITAARAGVEAVREDHPYTDRTYQLTETAKAEDLPGPMPEAGGGRAAAMEWPKPYAGFVDDKSDFAFTPKAIEKAEEVLEQQTELAVDMFIHRVSGGK